MSPDKKVKRILLFPSVPVVSRAKPKEILISHLG